MSDGTLTVERVCPYPRVTDILKIIIDTSFFTPESRDRGSFIHAATVIDEQGDLDESFEATALYMPYIRAWRKFLAEHECRWTHVEQRLVHEQFGYTGQPDRIGTVDGKPSVVDIKTGAAAKWHRLQGAAYLAMVPNPQRYQRLVVRLQEDGKAPIDPFLPHTYIADLGVFLACLTIHNYKLNGGK